MLKAVFKANALIALGLMILAAYFMAYAVRLPIGWDGSRGPGGGAFPFWLSLVLMISAGGALVKAVRTEMRQPAKEPFFEPGMVGPVVAVTLALTIAVFLMPLLGAYIALPLFMIWYLRFFGQNSWLITGILSLATPVVIFFFFEVALKILLPKGITEPLFIPLYALFF